MEAACMKVKVRVTLSGIVDGYHTVGDFPEGTHYEVDPSGALILSERRSKTIYAPGTWERVGTVED
jgi:hypothetical protein